MKKILGSLMLFAIIALFASCGDGMRDWMETTSPQDLALPGYVDIVSARYAINSPSLECRFRMRDLPADGKLLVNSASLDGGTLEYKYQVLFDVNNNGTPDYSLIAWYKKPDLNNPDKLVFIDSSFYRMFGYRSGTDTYTSYGGLNIKVFMDGDDIVIQCPLNTAVNIPFLLGSDPIITFVAGHATDSIALLDQEKTVSGPYFPVQYLYGM